MVSALTLQLIVLVVGVWCAPGARAQTTAVTKTDAAGWTLLVKQDSSKGDFFPKSLDGEYNIDHPEDKLYSHLDVDYSKFKSTDGKMTLQLRWPTIVNAEKTLTWRQSSSPMAAHGKVTGYEIQWGQEHDWNGGADFNGMAKSLRFVAPLFTRPCSPPPSPPLLSPTPFAHLTRPPSSPCPLQLEHAFGRPDDARQLVVRGRLQRGVSNGVRHHG